MGTAAPVFTMSFVLVAEGEGILVAVRDCEGLTDMNMREDKI